MGLIIRDHDMLAQRVRGLRDGGKRVVFTNGCFDLLHVGHIRCLTDAARRGDYLVVALNSDASIRKLKGAGRPVQSEEERAEILAAIQGVAYVTLFDEETCGTLLRKLRPHFVAKGTDYRLETLPEREVLAEIGAELILVGDPKNHSTIDLIAQIRSGKSAKPAGKSAGRNGKPAAKSARPAVKGAKPVTTRAKPTAGGGTKKPVPARAPTSVAKGVTKSVAKPAARAKAKAASEAHG